MKTNRKSPIILTDKQALIIAGNTIKRLRLEIADREADKARAMAEVRRELDDMRRQRDEAFQLSKCQCGTDEACRNLYQKQATIARLTKALETIEQWKAFPVIMHRGQTSSYETAYGSNGGRDYMRSIARQALNPSP